MMAEWSPFFFLFIPLFCSFHFSVHPTFLFIPLCWPTSHPGILYHCVPSLEPRQTFPSPLPPLYGAHVRDHWRNDWIAIDERVRLSKESVTKTTDWDRSVCNGNCQPTHSSSLEWSEWKFLDLYIITITITIITKEKSRNSPLPSPFFVQFLMHPNIQIKKSTPTQWRS